MTDTCFFSIALVFGHLDSLPFLTQRLFLEHRFDNERIGFKFVCPCTNINATQKGNVYPGEPPAFISLKKEKKRSGKGKKESSRTINRLFTG